MTRLDPHGDASADAGDVFRAHGATEHEAAELAAYARNAYAFDLADAPPPSASSDDPWPDEPFVSAWDAYAADAARVGVLEALRRPLVQLRFPVAEGMSRAEAYVAATRRGVVPAAESLGDGLRLARPDALRLFVHPTAAGRIPVVVAGSRHDFELLVRALTRRNEPEPVPPSMGACIVGGYNNWDRVGTLRREYECAALIHQGPSWDAHFRAEVVPRKELYQDRFILLSTGPYSATPAAAVGLDAEAWAAASLTIRLEHECAHYFTRRVFGSMRNSLLDELIADYAGIVSAAGRFRADWLLRFMGVEDAGRFRAGARLENYRGSPALSDGAFVVLQSLVRSAADALSRFDAWRISSGAAREDWNPLTERARAIGAIARAGLERLASPGGDRALRDAYHARAECVTAACEGVTATR